MANEFKGQPEHSAEHFGDPRDHWWNRDFLQLMEKRWGLSEVRQVLDFGCGIGHWTRQLAALLSEEAQIMGIDREPKWVLEATARARASLLEARFRYRQGEVERLPFADNSFDLTTCQTVLIHLAEPARALAEMLRVTKPGGLVVAAEPNNLSESLLLDSITNLASTDEVLELVRFQLTCERGKVALGEGDNSLGDRLPGLFVAQGLVDVEVYVNDKATALFPPYETAAQRAFVEDTRDRAARGIWNWSESDAQRLFLAGGGNAADFAAHFARGLAFRERIVRGLEAGTYHGVIGGLFYLVGGRKPRA
jgi:SAM-dependent methyltransferase